MTNGMTESTAREIIQFLSFWCPEVTTGDPVNGSDLIENLTNLYQMALEVVTELEAMK